MVTWIDILVPTVIALAILAALAAILLILRKIRPQTGSGSAAERLESGLAPATRGTLQATYTPRKSDPQGGSSGLIRGLEKAALIARLKPSREELGQLTDDYKRELAQSGSADKQEALRVSELISSTIPQTGEISALQSAKRLAALGADVLVCVANDLLNLRQATLDTITAAQDSLLQAQGVVGKTAPVETGFKLLPTAPRGNMQLLLEWAIENDVDRQNALKASALGKRLSLPLQNMEPTQFKALAAQRIGLLHNAVDGFRASMDTEPVGYLHLERLSFAPAGIERGELVYSVPLSPGEEVNITHKEWSNTSEEFERIVTDYMEEYSEEGVTEKNELAQSVNSQNQHSTALNTGVTVSGEYGGVNISTTFGYNASDSASKSEQLSRNKSAEMTSKASTRSKQEHKMSFKVASAAGTEDQTVRRIKNPFPDRATRVDYYQLIRKWRVDLLRYGIRLTYDLVIPQPAQGLLSLSHQIRQLKAALEMGMEAPIEAMQWDGFCLTPQDVLTETYQAEAAKYGVEISDEDRPDEQEKPFPLNWTCLWAFGSDQWETEALSSSSEVPPEYEVQSAQLKFGGYRMHETGESDVVQELRVIDPATGTTLFRKFETATAMKIIRTKNKEEKLRLWELNELGPVEELPEDPEDWDWTANGTVDELVTDMVTEFPTDMVTGFDWSGLSGAPKLVVVHRWYSSFWASINLTLQLRQSAKEAWQQRIWNKIHEAAENRYNERRQFLKDRLARLEEELGAQDALSLRKKEREEVMKGVLRWLEIPLFEFWPAGIGEDLYEGSGLVSCQVNRDVMREYGGTIRFLHHAVEWENMLYFLYPYFWSNPGEMGPGKYDEGENWEFKKTLDHPDPMHRTFLKAGAARVVLTIRPGFEEAFLAFLDKGDIDELPYYPYMTIAQEFESYARTNYPGIPPANPDKDVRPLLTLQQKKTWKDMQIIMQLLEDYRKFPFPKQRKAWLQMQWIMSKLDEYFSKNGKYPESLLDDLGYAVIDPWGHSYGAASYLPNLDRSGYTLKCLGADGQPGGAGEDEDIECRAQPYRREYPTTEEGLEALVEYFKGEFPGAPPDEYVPLTDQWGSKFEYRCSGTHAEYDLISYGADKAPDGEGENADINSWAEASLIGTWYEYTPTSALDIEFDQKVPVA